MAYTGPGRVSSSVPPLSPQDLAKERAASLKRQRAAEAKRSKELGRFKDPDPHARKGMQNRRFASDRMYYDRDNEYVPPASALAEAKRVR